MNNRGTLTKEQMPVRPSSGDIKRQKPFGTQPKSSIKQVKRGEIYYASISDAVGSEQSGSRPVLILQNDVGNRFSPTTIVAFVTSMNKKMNLPVHEELPKDVSQLPDDSVVLLEQIRTLDKERLIRKVSKLDNEYMSRINEKLLISLGIHSTLS
jgi:mRNA interferase MazF